jgi:ComF family protein
VIPPQKAGPKQTGIPVRVTRILSTTAARQLLASPAGERCVFPGQTVTLTSDVPPPQTSVWRAVVRVLRSPADSLSCALFPTPCALCGRSLLRLTRVPICDVCAAAPARQAGDLCSRCGESLELPNLSTGQSEEEPLCRPCRLAPPAFAKAAAYGRYEGRLRELVHLLKYQGMRPVAQQLGRMVADSVQSFSSTAPRQLVVIPVPMYAAKQRKRGFNHAELIARAAIAEMHRRDPQWKLRLQPSMLRRVRMTASQAGLTIAKRRQNLRGAFFVPEPGRLKGQHVLLVDDIYTTGATARACSQVLLRAGAASVYVVTVARAQREGVASWDPGFLEAAS